MDKYALQELAYKNGYAKGFADGSLREETKWIEKNGRTVCQACGANQLPQAEQNFCYKCGRYIK